MPADSSRLRMHADVTLDRPIVVAAFRGWNDAGDAATYAAQHLARVWNAERIASIDPEEFYDFQAVRPEVELVDGVTRRISWPANDFFAATAPGSNQDVLIIVGTEPNSLWRTFSALIVDVARSHGAQLVITLGALLADVPHSRPVHITGTAADEGLIARLGLQRSRYEGPTGIVGVLHDAFREAGIDSASLWAAVPHYLAVSPNPKAALALIEKATELIGVPAATEELTRAAAAYESRATEIVAADDDVTAYVRLLEERVDEREQEEVGSEELPSGEALAAELERFLRDRGDQ
jgi:predicted ATP-grasp superfamily ATP-dependent carboligase